jgi:putative addiction module component
MSLHEKLAAMESLWVDIAGTPEALESPAWHKDLLDERHQRLVEGQSPFIDWETAKADLRNTISMKVGKPVLEPTS